MSRRHWTRTVIYIDHKDAAAYRVAGWTVVPLEGYAGYWSMLAWRQS
jgi:hypothetical protein